MKKIFFIIIPSLLVLSACNKLNIADGTPKCVENEIKDFEKSSDCNDASVSEYLFQNKTVYVFEPGTCGADMTSSVMSEDCAALGTLGGITGNTEINGEDFSKATFVKVVWKK